MSKYFLVYNTQGADIGIFKAANGDEAIAAMLADAGYYPGEILPDPRIATKEIQLDQILEIVKIGGDWAHSGYIDEVAIEWYKTGLSVEEISDWLAAGCFRAKAAVALDNKGITPDQASTRKDGCTVAYWVSNGDMSIGEAKYAIDNAND